jgi:2-polyprenyl-3-methyl-5-hydroxy-6-metoxy-1,4-benzoquinol methylase
LLTSRLVNNKLCADGVSANVFTHALELLSFSGSTPPKDVLILGLGAGIVATNLKNMGANVEVIELDHIVEKIAREYFSFKGDDILVTIEDARTFVRTCQKKYDVVIVDLFRGDGIPSHVVSQEFFNDIKSCLHDDGAIVMNAFYGTKDLQSKKALLKTIVSVFGKIVVFETLTNTSAEMTSGYILARNREQWSYNISLLGKPEFVIKKLKRTFQNSTIYGQNSDLLKNTTPIYDNKNDWTRISSYIDTVYRKKLISHIPWQVLLD